MESCTKKKDSNMKKGALMGHWMRCAVLVTVCCFIQQNDFPPHTVAGAYLAELDGNDCFFQRHKLFTSSVNGALQQQT